MVSDQERTPELKAWWLAARIAAHLPIPVPQTEYDTKDPEWIRHARAEMDMLSELRAAIRDHPEEVLDALEIMQDSTRLNFFATKGERRQMDEWARKTPEEIRANSAVIEAYLGADDAELGL